MEQWKQQIGAGNRFFNSEDYEQAENHYLLSLIRARTLFTTWFEPKEAVAALVISHLNLADLKREQKLPEQAGNELRNLNAYLTRALQSVEGSDREEAVRDGLRKSHLALVDHIKEFGSLSSEALLSGDLSLIEPCNQQQSIN